MTAEEAINLIKDDFRCFGYPKLTSAKKMAIEALEKQIPKPPVDIDDEFDMFVCPNCNVAIGVIGDKESHHFCLNCGQALQMESDSADE